MKVIVCALAIVAVFGVYAGPPKVYVQRLPYYRPPTWSPHQIRVRRQIWDGQLVSVDLTKDLGTPNQNVLGQAFAAGNTHQRPVTTRGTLAYNNNGLNAALTKTHNPGGIDTFKPSGNVELINNYEHKVDNNVFKSQNKLANDFKFERTQNGAGLDYRQINDHGASLTHSHIPNFGNQLESNGKANLWASQDHNTRLDFSDTASQRTSGPLTGQRNCGSNLGLTQYFR